VRDPIPAWPLALKGRNSVPGSTRTAVEAGGPLSRPFRACEPETG
jgi:hypothetical protein